MDPWFYSALISSLLLAMAIVTARWALKGFGQSKQALREAASYVSVIVGALSTRIESLEKVSNQVRGDIGTLSVESTTLQSSNVSLESRCRELEKSIEDMLTRQREILHELEILRSKPVPSVAEPRPIPEGDPVLDRLTGTERETLQILREVGPLHAPELGRRVNKSREHMARLMKRLYLEGYVDRETDRPPFRYTLNDKLRSSLGTPVNPSRSENV